MANFSPETPTITTTVLASTSTVPVAAAAVDDNSVDNNTCTSPELASINTMATFQTPAPPVNAYFRRAAPQLPPRTLSSSNVSSLHYSSSAISSVPILPRESPTVGLLGGVFADNSNTNTTRSSAGTDCGVVFKLPPRRPTCRITGTIHSRTSSSPASSSNRTGNGCNSIDDLGVLLDQECTPIGRFSLSVPTTIATTLVNHNKNKKRSVDEEDNITTPSVVFHDCDDYDGKNLPLMNLDMIMEEENEEHESDYNDNAQQQLEQDDDSKAPELEIINKNFQSNNYYPKIRFHTTNEVLKSDSRFNVYM